MTKTTTPRKPTAKKATKKSSRTPSQRWRILARAETVTLTAGEALALCTAVELAMRSHGAPKGRIATNLFHAVDKLDLAFDFRLAGEEVK